MLHGVSNKDHFIINGRHLPVTQFRSLLFYLKKNFEIRKLCDLCEMKVRGVMPEKRTIALTFDDGFRNNLSTALPLLEELKIPATFFICTASLTESAYIHITDYLDLVRFSVKGPVRIGSKIFRESAGRLLDAETGEEALQYINSLGYQQWQSIFEQLKSDFPASLVTTGIEPGKYATLSTHDLELLRKSAFVSIGSHSHEHVNLAALDPSDIESQVSKSSRILQNFYRDEFLPFAFPFGYFNASVVDIAKRAGFRYLIAGGEVAEPWKSHLVPRIGVLSMASVYYNILSINRGFKRFGF